MKLAGLAGEHQYITVVPGYDDPNDPRNAVLPGGQPGPYRVVFTLARRGFPLLPEYQFSMAGGLEGNSHIRLDGSEIAVSAKLPSDHELRFRGLKNANGCLGKIEVVWRARSTSAMPRIKRTKRSRRCSAAGRFSSTSRSRSTRSTCWRSAPASRGSA